MFLDRKPNAVKMAVLLREIQAQRSLNQNLTTWFAVFDKPALKAEIPKVQEAVVISVQQKGAEPYSLLSIKTH